VLKKDQTENKIKETAKKLFFKEGRFNATTQEIADAAGVNRTLINYYFRSRNNLFKIVFEDAIQLDESRRETIMDSDLNFKDKIAEFIDFSLEMNIEYPYLESYIVSQMNQGIPYKKESIKEKSIAFFANVEQAMEDGIIDKMEPIQFLLNMISLINFPMAMRPLLQENLQISEQQYQKILKERKAIILKTLFKH
jgi:TetR/AcrR family transcriptional regulator